MTEQDPRPWKSSGEAPAELVRALRALGEGGGDAARLARVGERLGARIAAGGGAAAGASVLRQLFGTKAGLTSLAVGFGALGLLGYALIAERDVPDPVRAPARQIPAAARSQAAPVSQRPVQTPAVATPRRTREPAEAPTSAAPAQGNPRPRVARAPGRSHAEPSIAPASIAAPAQPPSQPEAEQPEAEQPEAEQPEAEQPKTAEKAPTAQPSEVALLQQARKVAASQPAAALRLLREHSERFPSGLLTPEREVLTIEVLRRLGRNAEAEQRLQRFAARYPKSIYLRRLQHGAAAARER